MLTLIYHSVHLLIQEMIALANILPVPFFDNIETIRQLTEKTRSDLNTYLLTTESDYNTQVERLRDIENKRNALRELRYDLDLIKRGSELLIQEIDSND